MNTPYGWVDASSKTRGLLEFRPNEDEGLRYSVNKEKKAMMFAHNDGRKVDLTIQPADKGMNIILNDAVNMTIVSVSSSSLSLNFFRNGYFTGKSLTFPNGEKAYFIDAKTNKTKRFDSLALSFVSPTLRPHFFPRSNVELTKESPTDITYRSLVPTDNLFLEAHEEEDSLSLRIKGEFSFSLVTRGGKEVLVIKDDSNKDAATFEYKIMEQTLCFFDKKCSFSLSSKGDMKVTNVDPLTKEEKETDLGNILSRY